MTDDRDYLVCCRVKFPISKICWVFFVGHLGLFQTATKPKPFLSLPTGVKPNISHRLYNCHLPDYGDDARVKMLTMIILMMITMRMTMMSTFCHPSNWNTS